MSPFPGEPVDADDEVVSNQVVTLLGKADPNRLRHSVLIINTGSATMRVTTDGTDPAPNHGKQISAGSSLTLSSPTSQREIKAIRQDGVDTTANVSVVY